MTLLILSCYRHTVSIQAAGQGITYQLIGSKVKVWVGETGPDEPKTWPGPAWAIVAGAKA